LLNALKRTQANGTGLVAVVLVLSIHPPPPPRCSATLEFVIPRVCNFIDFAKKPLLKTNSLGASKIAKNQ
jgi:hypothetical protein